ncbi:MAG: hypothetical protein LBF41_10475 [Deltaproteobacteria bacterium]|jgi:hypothetical protein|nr:hypothetical protein [Deltaproteobacteria bacterium]
MPPTTERFPGVKAGQKKGMVLAFTLSVLVLMSLMGIVILSNTRTELSVSGTNRVNREAFNVAETAAMVSILMGRIVLHPVFGMKPSDILRPKPGPEFPMTIQVDDDDDGRLNLLALEADEIDSDTNYTHRYVQTLETDPGALDPHVIFSIDGRVVATAVISLESEEPVAAGMSLEQGGAVKVTLVATVRGEPMNEISTADAIVPRSIITTMFRDYLDGAS